MIEQQVISINHIQSEIKSLMAGLQTAASAANKANSEVVQLAWDLGDKLLTVREESPENYSTFLDSLKISKDVEKAWIKVRQSAETKEELQNQNSMRQAMLAMVVPSKEEGEERIELVPPQTFYQWVNKSNSWLKKVEIGLVKADPVQLKTATVKLYEFLKNIHE
jgi:hypothetical protein